jgi:hypothetical protein
MDSLKEYVAVCELLGLAWQKTDAGSVIAANGFFIQDGRGPRTSLCGFRESPVSFFRILMTKIRRNCEHVDKTHIGAVLGGRLLDPSEFQDGVSIDEGNAAGVWARDRPVV